MPCVGVICISCILVSLMSLLSLVNNYTLSVKECCDILQNVFVLSVQVKPEIFSFLGNSTARLWFVYTLVVNKITVLLCQL